nr:hypothetical protein [Bacteroidota bacterium]
MKRFVTLLFLLITATLIFSQEGHIRNPLGLTIEYGIGTSAFTDAFISQERYSGTMPYLESGMADFMKRVHIR